MILLELNRYARDNYAFFDPSVPIELTLRNPRGYSPRLTESILRGLRGRTLIDVEGKIDIAKGVIKDGEKSRKEETKREETRNANEEKRNEEEVLVEKEVYKNESAGQEKVQEEKEVAVSETKATAKKTQKTKK